MSELLSKEQAAVLLGVSYQTISREVQNKSLPAIKVGKKFVKFKREDLENYMRRNSTIQAA
jgi:excisionase family DNA binding protein